MINKQNWSKKNMEDVEEVIRKKYKKREKKKKVKMKISGAGVKNLAKIIKGK